MTDEPLASSSELIAFFDFRSCSTNLAGILRNGCPIRLEQVDHI